MFGILGGAISAATGGASDTLIGYGIDKATNTAINYGLKSIGVNVGTKKK